MHLEGQESVFKNPHIVWLECFHLFPVLAVLLSMVFQPACHCPSSWHCISTRLRARRWQNNFIFQATVDGCFSVGVATRIRATIQSMNHQFDQCCDQTGLPPFSTCFQVSVLCLESIPVIIGSNIRTSHGLHNPQLPGPQIGIASQP